MQNGPADPLPRRMRGVEALDDLEPRARRFLPRPVFAYVSGTTERGATAAGVRAAYDALAFRPRVLRDVSGRSRGRRLFGRDWAAPFGVAPMGMAALAAYRGDEALALAAARAGIPAVVSATALTSYERVLAVNPQAWAQVYVPGEPDRIRPLVARIAAAGATALVVTVDLPVAANPEHFRRAGFSSPLRPSLRLLWDGAVRPAWSLGVFARTLATRGMPHFENSMATRGAPILARDAARDFGARDSLGWEHIRLIRDLWTGPLVVKGLTDPEDAAKAAEEGADGVILSAHGGRALDGAIAPLRTLAAVRARCPGLAVMIDSGIRRGTDVLKAIALGADFVWVGRPFLYAAALGGEAGVSRAIAILDAEIDRNMALLGLVSLAEMTPDRLAVQGPCPPPLRPPAA